MQYTAITQVNYYPKIIKAGCHLLANVDKSNFW